MGGSSHFSCFADGTANIEKLGIYSESPIARQWVSRIRTSHSGLRAVPFFFFLFWHHTHTHTNLYFYIGGVEKKVAPILGPIQWQLLVS